MHDDSVMDTETFHRARRGECGGPLMHEARGRCDVTACLFFSVHQGRRHGDGGRMKDHLLNLWREEEYLLKSDLRASS